MKKRIFLVIDIVVIIGLITFMYINLDNNDLNTGDNMKNDEKEIKINIKINNRNFIATFVNNETTRELIQLFPTTFKMSDLNKNEKYYYLTKNLPTNSFTPQKISNGDILLYGSNCLVLFYENFNTPYSYTNIGKIDNPNDLAQELGEKDINVTFELMDR